MLAAVAGPRGGPHPGPPEPPPAVDPGDGEAVDEVAAQAVRSCAAEGAMGVDFASHRTLRLVAPLLIRWMSRRVEVALALLKAVLGI